SSPDFEHTGARGIFRLSICVLCFFAVGVNLIKDGLGTWVPSILKEEFFLADSLSILLTLFLPILAIFGNAFALKIHKKIPDYVYHCLSVFGVIAVLFGVIIGCLNTGTVFLVLAGLVAVNFLACSLNSLLTSVFPLFMREQINSGRVAGVINGFCYLGSTLSSIGLGSIADRFGWSSAFATLILFCILCFLFGGVYALCRRRG
ncbi:MAG: hypothetical protein II328_01065, partial [Clostridia bacterium]|nr:hypothetical protein [Clostridia bacterium]